MVKIANIRINRKRMLTLSNSNKERNIYAHPFFIARDIFWQRLERVFDYLARSTNKTDNVLDFGGGSGVFCKALSQLYNKITIIDLDTEEVENIIQHYHLDNVECVNSDINKYTSKEKYDVIIATDVLEHFKDLSEPLNFFKKFLAYNGLLIVTLPTENKLYEVGRRIINKKKPIDHFHKSKDVVAFLQKHGFEIIESSYIPKYIIHIPLFEFVAFKYKGNSKDT